MARALQSDAARTHPLFAWIVMRDRPEYPGAFVARLVTNAPNALHPGRAHAGRNPRPFAAGSGAFRSSAVRPAGRGGGVVSGIVPPGEVTILAQSLTISGTALAWALTDLNRLGQINAGKVR